MHIQVDKMDRANDRGEFTDFYSYLQARLNVMPLKQVFADQIVKQKVFFKKSSSMLSVTIIGIAATRQRVP